MKNMTTLAVLLVLAAGSASAQRKLLQTPSFANCLNNGNCWNPSNANDIRNHYMAAHFAGYVYDSYARMFLGIDNVQTFNATFYSEIKPLGVTFFNSTYEATRDTEFTVFATATDVFVAFRGSEFTYGDWIQSDFGSLVFTTTSDYGTVAGKPISICKGFHDSMTLVMSSMIDQMDKAGAKGKRVWFMGHSLGAAMCTLGAAYAKNKGYDVRGVYPYGSPRTGADTWVQRYNDMGLGAVTYRWVNYVYLGLSKDLVTTVPTWARHVGASYKVDSCKAQETAAGVSVLAHLPNLYREGVWQCVPESLRGGMPPYQINWLREGRK